MVLLMDSRLINLNKQVNSSSLFRPVRGAGGVESTIVHNSTLYKLHVFTTVGSDSFSILDAGSDGQVEVLVVAGGGGGGMDMGGGGGGGGVIYTTYVVKPGELIPVTVGAGGQGGPQGSGGYRTDGTGPQPSAHQFTISATNGGNSVFGNLTAIGGGYGGSSYFDYTPNLGIGASGGSGGGTSGYSNGTVKAGQAGTAGQGYRGGQGGGQYYSGGGGGAGGIGTDSTAQPNGGPGRLCSILGVDLYWGGGGGGSSYTLATGGNGGIGGGGGGALGTTTGGAGYNNGQAGYGGSPASWANTRGGAGGANTGGGGGGGSHYNATNLGGEGGSGIVVVRYPLERPLFIESLPVTSGLVMNLDIGSPYSYPGGGTFIYDLTGNGFNGTMINSPTYSSNNLGYLEFNGSNNNVRVDKPFPNISGQISMEIWVYFNNLSTNPSLLHKGSHYTMQIYSAGSYSYADSSNYSYANYGNRSVSGLGTTGVWRQLMITKDTSNNVRLYMNGTLVDTRATFGSALTQTNTTLWLAGYSDTDSTPTGSVLNGRISIARIYNRQLSDTEVLQNFNANRSRYGI